MKAFMFREIDKDNRDCCSYLDAKYREGVLHLNTCGACFYGSSTRGLPNYDTIETVLTEEEYNAVSDYIRVSKGILSNFEHLVKNSKPIVEQAIKKLQSDEGKEFFEKIVADEKEYLKEQWNLSDKDIEDIFDAYPYEYKDRAIVGVIYEDYYELGETEALNVGYHLQSIGKIMDRYFNYEKFGEDLVEENGEYVELDDGRIVYLMM
jgi:hypothetical protein